MIYKGDCLEIMQELEDNSIDLIYLDPPFFTQKNHSLSDSSGEVYEFSDSWSSLEDYISFLESRIKECRRILKPTGSIFVHCDKQASHYIRILMDKIFGYNRFINEIIWNYKRWSNTKKGLLNTHQNIFWYSKTEKYTFNILYTNYSPTTNIDQILLERVRNKKTNKSEYSKKVSKEKKGVPLGDVWEIPFLNPKAKERVGYPTQKPILLLENIIKLASSEGHIILDPFCGSGTSLVASKILNRDYIGIDASEKAINLAKKRLLNPFKTESKLMKVGKNQYLEKDQKKVELLEHIGAKIVYRNKKVDGLLNSSTKGLTAIKIQGEQESLQEAVSKVLDFSLIKGLKYSIVIKYQSDIVFMEDIIPKIDNVSIVDINEIDKILDLV